MTLTVEAVAKNGKGLMTPDKKWHNADKHSKCTFAGLKKGDVIEVQTNDDGYISSYSLSEGSPAKASVSSSHSSTGVGVDRDANIARAVALKGALEFVSAFENKNLTMEQGYDKVRTLSKDLAAYLSSGVFPSESK